MLAKGLVARFRREAVIRKEKGQYCVRSPDNADWNGGCYPSKGEAEKRLKQVEYFKNKAAYSYDRRIAKTLNLGDYGLEGLTTGQTVTLYHGTTRLFHTFDLGASRDELVDRFYGRGIFLTPSKRIAIKYAYANRNIGFPVSIISDLSRKNPVAGAFLKTLYDHGQDGWEVFWKANGYWTENPPPGVGQVDMERFEGDLGVDSNDLSDVADYILGSAAKPLGSDEPVNIFNTSTGLPDYVYDTLDKVGLNSKVYRPKVYTVAVTVTNPLITSSKSQASKARSKGYDSVIYYGPDLVDGVPEVAVYSPQNAKVRRIEIL